MHRRPPNGKVRVTYLEMRSPPRDAPLAAPAGVTLSRIARADLAQYRALYRRVGDPWQWVARRMLDDGALREVLDHPRYELWYPLAEGAPIGFAELDRREPPDVEIRYFGLIDQWIGRGAGSLVPARHDRPRLGGAGDRGGSGCTPASSTIPERCASTSSAAWSPTEKGSRTTSTPTG